MNNCKRITHCLLIFTILYSPFLSFSQSDIIKHARFIIDTLSSPHMHGRGYINKGDSIAADFIYNEYAKLHLASFGKDFYQSFPLNVNTFPGKAELHINGTNLSAGKDFLPGASSCSCTGKKKLILINRKLIDRKDFLPNIQKTNLQNKALLIDTTGISKHQVDILLEKINYPSNNPLLFISKEKLTHSLSQTQKSRCTFIISDKSLPIFPKKIYYRLNTKWIGNYSSQNVIGYIKGVQKPDSFIVFSAHYDHLGQIGKEIYFPGANDNASGCAMLLSLAEYYSVLSPKYSIIFIAFGGEELGLLGSNYYIDNQLFKISNVKFMINLDIAGTGDEGIKVVNATEHPQEFEKLVKLNSDKKLLPFVLPRGKAANSDHYHFSQAGVKTFFIYTLGGIKAYHDVYDKPETLPLTKFKELFELLIDFTDSL